MCNTCKSEGDHKDQIENYPLGSVVVLLAEIVSDGLCNFPVGSVGIVSGHCDDGRAIIHFEKSITVSHTFHFPETYITRAFIKNYNVLNTDHRKSYVKA